VFCGLRLPLFVRVGVVRFLWCCGAGGSFFVFVGLALSGRVAFYRFRQLALRQWLGLCQGCPLQVCVVNLQSAEFGFLVLLPALCDCGRFCGWLVAFCPLRLSVSGGVLFGVAGLVVSLVFQPIRANRQACVFVVAKPGFCW